MLGEQHADTLHSLNNLGLALYRQGEYAEAARLYAGDGVHLGQPQQRVLDVDAHLQA